MFFGSNLSKSVEERAIRQTNEILEEFTNEFLKWYAVSVLKKCKEDVKGQEKEDMLLERAPSGAEAFKKGSLFKVD
jgi:hypothetical protein